jgi:predicted kinase
MRTKIIVLQGVPASGKSTFAKEFVKGKKGWIRVSRDDIRWMRGDYWIPEQEDYISDVEVFMVQKALEKGLNVIIDATNLNQKTIRKWNRISEIYRSEIEFKFFEIGLEEAIERDLKREFPVGEETIRDFYGKYIQ